MFLYFLYTFALVIIPIFVGAFFYQYKKSKKDFFFPTIIYSIIATILLCVFLINPIFNKIYYIPTTSIGVDLLGDRLILYLTWLFVLFALSSIYYHSRILNELSKKNRFTKYFYIIIRVYVIVCFLMFIVQTNILFIPSAEDELNVQLLQKNNVDFKKIEIITKDGIKFSGYFLPKYKSQDKKELNPIIVYFGGNAEEVSGFFAYSYKIPDYSIISFNYRGYGESTGSPSTEMAYDVGDILKYLSKNYPNTPRIFVGRSIGTAFASTAHWLDVKPKTILITPFNKFVDRAKEQYPFLPVYMLLRYRFDNGLMFGNAGPTQDAQLGVFVAENDEVINPKFGIEFYNQANTKNKTLKIIKNVGHNDIMESKEFWQEFSNYLRK